MGAKGAKGEAIDALVAEFAGGQHGVITARQLLGVGLSRTAI